MSKRVVIVEGGDMADAAAIARELPVDVPLDVVPGDAEAVAALAHDDVIAVVAAPPIDRPALRAARAAVAPVARLILSRAPDGEDVVTVPAGDLVVPPLANGVRAAMATLRAAIHHARVARELYDDAAAARVRAVLGPLRALSRAFAIARPAIAERCARISRMASTVAMALGITPLWPIEMAACVFQLGALAVPQPVLDRAAVGLPLDPSDAALLSRMTQLAEEILVQLPDAEAVLDIVHWRERDFATHSESIPIGARVLRAVADFDALLNENTHDVAFGVLLSRTGRYDPAVLDALRRSFVHQGEGLDAVREVDLDALVPGVVIVEDVLAANGMVLVKRGHTMTARLISLLRNFEPGGVRLPLRVASVLP
jgi:hypothetical protein